jgi:hypothetical protein
MELQDIINHNMDAIHKLAQLGTTIAKDNPKEQEAIVRVMSCLWNYLKPVHKWIREQNPTQAALYEELDKYIALEENRSLDVKSLTPKPIKSRKGKK